MNTGTCKYASNCRYDHPELVDRERLHDNVCDLELRLAALQAWWRFFSLPHNTVHTSFATQTVTRSGQAVTIMRQRR